MKLGGNMKIKVHSKLGNYLDKRGIKRSWLAEQLGATKTQVTNWCKNVDELAFSTPSVGFLLKIEKVLNCSINDLWELKEE